MDQRQIVVFAVFIPVKFAHIYDDVDILLWLHVFILFYFILFIYSSIHINDQKIKAFIINNSAVWT